MNKFEELDVPKEVNLGWYVIGMFGNLQYLHDDCQLHTGVEDSYFSSSGYFPCEFDAHQCAERYYFNNCRKYPYTTLLNGSRNMNDGSQIMTFED